MEDKTSNRLAGLGAWGQRPLKTSTKNLLWYGAWGVVIIGALIVNPTSLAAFYAFPLGLLAWLPNGDEKAVVGLMFGGWIVGWIFYILISVALSRIKKKGLFLCIYFLFCILLMLNVVGCQRVLEAASGIR